MAAFLLAVTGMKLSHVAALFALAMPVFGCASDPVAGGGDESQGDINAKGTEFDCVIVEVLDGLLEEGLGSIYDYDSDGFPEADGDSITVSLSKDTQLSAIKSKMMLSIGQITIGLHDAKDQLEQIKDDPNIISWRGNQAKEEATDSNPEPAEPTIFIVRIFKATGLGFVQFQDGEDGEVQDLAKIDCRAGVSVPDFDALE